MGGGRAWGGEELGKRSFPAKGALFSGNVGRLRHYLDHVLS